MHTSNSAPPAPALPVIDISALTATSSGATEEAVAECTRRIGEACRGQGFFYVVQHGVPEQLERELEAVAREYFALPDCEKREISMERGGLAWRGSFLVGDELTSGVPDQKEGIYYGEEEDEGDEGDEGAGPPRPLRGKNLFHDSALGE
jgi:isopenicillin N synthase-like dioxygenase